MDNATPLTEIMALRGGGVISIVGAGGKTTLMERLASEILARGETVLISTTTRILMPRNEPPERVVISGQIGAVLERAKDLLSASGRVTAASAYVSSDNKLVGFRPEQIEELEQGNLFDWILVEADGARRLPLKAPATHEPVVPCSSRWVVAVAGLDAIGRPLTEEWVFRSRLFAEITGLAPGAAITEESVAAALVHEKGIMKDCPAGAIKYVFLNKAETEDRRLMGRRIARILQEEKRMRPERVIIGALEWETEPLEWYGR
jgi:probable selenium-dependent hydroxylase accessory protein YqeC